MRFLGWLLVFLCAAWQTSRVMGFEGFKEAFENLARTQLFEEWCLELFLASSRPARQARERKEHKSEEEFGEASFRFLGRGCSSGGAC